MTRKWYAILPHPKMHPHTKLENSSTLNRGNMYSWEETCNFIDIVLEFKFKQRMKSFGHIVTFLSRMKPFYYPPTKSEGYSFGVVRASIRPCVHSVRPSVHPFCLSGTISQYLLVRFDSFLVQMISTMNSRYPISLVKIDPLTLELLPLFKYRQL